MTNTNNITKICSVCKTELPYSAFYLNKSHDDGYTSECKVCNRIRRKTLRKLPNPEYAAQQLARRIKEPTCTCHKCKQILTHDHFYSERHKPFAHSLECKVCTSKRKKLAYRVDINLSRQKDRERKARPESILTDKKWRLEHKEHIKQMAFKHRLKREYNLSLEEYDLLLVKQSNVCAICKKSETAFVKGSKTEIKPLAVDHDHITNKVRGLLCQKCNMGIGLLNHNIKSLQSAIIYLA